jgi:hypothetical protein
LSGIVPPPLCTASRSCGRTHRQRQANRLITAGKAAHIRLMLQEGPGFEEYLETKALIGY